MPPLWRNRRQADIDEQQRVGSGRGNRVLALVFQTGGQADDEIAGFTGRGGRLGELTVRLAEEFQPWNMDHTRELPAARVGVNQRREQLHQRQKAEDCDAGSLLHSGMEGVG